MLGEQDFFALTRSKLADFLREGFELPPYRAAQIYQWIYQRKQQDFSLMSNLSKEVRKRLATVIQFPELSIERRQISSDGSRKYLFKLNREREQFVEAVMIKQPKRMTLCVSSQVGCAMACRFCQTGTMKLRGNLRASEIVQQVLAVIKDAKEFGDMFQNVVFMGMGEPLHNYQAVVDAISILKDQFGLGISGRKITVSSVGLVPAIDRFGGSGLDVNLAISLNATTDEVRSQIMPINKRYPLKDLLQCLKNFPLKRRKRITIEYVLLDGVNDSDQDIERLPTLLKGLAVKVNLIPYNENVQLGYKAPSRATVLRWQDRLLRSGLDTTIRWSKGSDIQAACGQLATTIL